VQTFLNIASVAGSLLTVTVAAIAVGVSVWSGFWTRRHDQLASRPFLRITHITENKQGVDVGVVLQNVGLGPAVIDRVTVMHRRTRQFAVGPAGLSEIIEPIRDRLELINLHVHWLESGAVRVEDQFKLLFLPSGDPRELWMRGLVSAINIRIEYSSIYGTPQRPEYLHPREISEEEFSRAPLLDQKRHLIRDWLYN
jgi:hypothetical protein